MSKKQYEDVSVDRNDDFINIKIPIDELDNFDGNVRIDLPKDKKRVNVNDYNNYDFVPDFEEDDFDFTDETDTFDGYEDNNYGDDVFNQDNTPDEFDAEMAEINGESFDNDIDFDNDLSYNNEVDSTNIDNVDPYIGAYLASALVANDIFHIKLNAKGKDFDNIQSLCYLYYTAFTNMETLCRIALGHGNVPNPSMAKETLQWTVQNDTNYDYNKAVNNIKQIINTYLQYLRRLYEALDDDSKVEIGSIINQWSSELNYCYSRRTDV